MPNKRLSSAKNPTPNLQLPEQIVTFSKYIEYPVNISKLPQLPTFMNDQLDIWFYLIEAEFAACGICNDEIKYNATLMALDAYTLNKIKDIIKAPPAKDKYNTLKNTIIKRITESRHRQIDSLLNDIALGDKKPSQLLREMQNITVGGISDEILYNFWVSHLPTVIRPLLQKSDSLNLNALAEIADRLMMVLNQANVIAATDQSHITSKTPSLSSLETKLDKLQSSIDYCIKEIDEIKNQQHMHRELKIISERSCSKIFDEVSKRQVEPLDSTSQNTTKKVCAKDQDNLVTDTFLPLNKPHIPRILDFHIIKEHQKNDEKLKQLNWSLWETPLNKLIFDDVEIYCDITENYVRPYLPETLRKIAFDIEHKAFHLSNTSCQIEKKYFWPKMSKCISNWIKECSSCQRSKDGSDVQSKSEHLGILGKKFEHIHLNLIELPERNQYKYCLIIIDQFTKWPVAVPLKKANADAITTALFDHWIAHYGTPMKITSVDKSQFQSIVFLELTKVIGCNIEYIQHDSESNNIIDIWFRKLKSILTNSPMPWTEILSTVLLGLRTSLKEDMQSSPAEMLYGTTLCIPGEFFVNANSESFPDIVVNKHRRYMRDLRPTSTACEDKSKVFIARDIHTCSHAFILNIQPDKTFELEPSYRGPYKITKRCTDKLYELDVNGILRNVNIDSLQPAYVDKLGTQFNLGPLEN